MIDRCSNLSKEQPEFLQLLVVRAVLQFQISRAPIPILPQSRCNWGTVAQPLRACEREPNCQKEDLASAPQILPNKLRKWYFSRNSNFC